MTAIFTKQIIGFVDLLGFSSALESSDDGKMNGILQLQTRMRSAVGDHFYEETQIALGQTRIRAKPAISAFSDNFLVSMPAEIDGRWSSLICFGPVGHQLTWVAQEALILGLPIRGGIALGDLYHQQGIAFGRGLVRAASIEEREAFYPRIVLDKILVAQYPEWQRDCFEDEDGSICFDYLKHMMIFGHQPHDDSQENYRRHTEWPDALIKICENHIKALPANSSARAFQNWNWLRKDMDRAADLAREVIKNFEPR